MRAKLVFCILSTLLLTGCSARTESKDRRDAPALSLSSDKVTTREVSFYSQALQRTMRYRILLPKAYEHATGRQYPLLILLHGRNSGIGERDWHMHSNLLATMSGADLVVVLPQGDDSYYINAARKPKDRYEDYVVSDLLGDVESNYRVLRTRDGRGIGGVSMGGWGALNLGMRHPELFSFVAAMSGPLDITERAFSWRRFWNSLYLRSVFGTTGNREQFDLYRLEKERSAELHNTFFFLSCGTHESLLEPNRRMARAMAASGLKFTYKEVQGAHGWTNWNQLLPEVIREARARLGRRG